MKIKNSKNIPVTTSILLGITAISQSIATPVVTSQSLELPICQHQAEVISVHLEEDNSNLLKNALKGEIPPDTLLIQQDKSGKTVQILIKKQAILNGRDISAMETSLPEQKNGQTRNSLYFKLSPDAQKKFADITKNNLFKRIVLVQEKDNTLISISVARINEPIVNGEIILTDIPAKTTSELRNEFAEAEVCAY